MKLNVERRDRIRRGRTEALKRIPAQSGFTCFGCHGVVYPREKEREREREKERDIPHHNQNRKERKKRIHEKCMNM